MRSLVALLLSLMLAVSSVGMAVARGQEPGAGGPTLTLCTTLGSETVTLDAAGNPVPVKPVHLCPDCLSGVLALALGPAQALPLPPLTKATKAAPMVDTHPASADQPTAQARDPPPFH